MKERQWMGHDWQPTVSEPEKKVSADEAKEIYLQLLHEKLKDLVDAGAISQADMDRKFIQVGYNLPPSHLFPQEDVKKYGIDKVSIKKSDIELCAEIMAIAQEASSDDKASKKAPETRGGEVN